MTIICFSHLRWNFVYQRPQHLFTRFAKEHEIYVIEEPMYDDGYDRNIVAIANNDIKVVTPYLNNKQNEIPTVDRQRHLLKKLFHEHNISNYIFWYYSPMMFLFSRNFHPSLIIYDCMDELSAFRHAPPELKQAEAELFKEADVVFTGGYSLYYAKKDKHFNVHPFPSSIEKEHFLKARTQVEEPADQANIPHPRFGFFGVLDERFDIDLMREVSARKPEWNFIFLGPVVKINSDELPQSNNVFYLGSKSYNQLPDYISGWDVALIPFALNESTAFISPTKTPEYLAAGKPVISTAIKDVVKPYGEKNLVHIINSADEFINAGEEILQQKDNTAWLYKVDEFLATNSWDKTYADMHNIIKQSLTIKNKNINSKKEIYV